MYLSKITIFFEKNYKKKFLPLKLRNIYAFYPFKKPISLKLHLEKQKELCNKWIFKDNNFFYKIIFFR